MKAFILIFSLFFMANSVFASTLEEDLAEIKPQMDMLSVQTPAVLNLLDPLVQKGNAIAAYLAATIYENGRLVEKDEAKALELYIKAAEKMPKAQMKVAGMYAFGQGTEISFPHAIAYYGEVLKCDDENLKREAAERIIILGDIIKKEQAIKEREDAALKGEAGAMLDVANLCLSIDNFVCAYVWLSLSKKHPAFEKSAEELQDMIDRLSGEMTMSQIMEAEGELQKINQAAKK